MNTVIFKRISGTAIPQHIGEHVTLLGELIKVEPNGRVLTLKTSPDNMVTVHLQYPVQDMLCSFLEVQGVVSNADTIQAENVNKFQNEITSKMDLPLYNEVVGLANRLSSHYTTMTS